MGDNGPYVLSNLTFTPVRLEDKGRYECRLATSGSGTGYATTVEVLIGESTRHTARFNHKGDRAFPASVSRFIAFFTVLFL